MNILGIETSCDETAVAVVKDGKEVLSNVVASSQELHAATGGIIPENAARRQIESMLPVLSEALDTAFPDSKNPADQFSKIDAIAVTYGPGLIGSLLVGVETAKTLSYIYNKPLIPVNHLVAHLYGNWIFDEISDTKYEKRYIPEFPAVGLVISGGHTDFVLMKDRPSSSTGQVGDIKWIGGTRDDAAGEAFDKTARLIGLPYPGGPSISNSAKFYLEKNSSENLDFFPRPMIDTEDLDMSFSGLKTSVLNETKTSSHTTDWYAAQIQEAIVDSIVTKSIFAVKKYKPKSFLVSGGVAANTRLRDKLAVVISENHPNVKLHVPPIKYCTDNGAVIATAAYYLNKKVNFRDLSANPSLTIED